MAASAWTEPSSSIPLRFGSYRRRYVTALVLIVAGAVSMQFASAYTLGLLLAGVIATIAGWIVVPSPGWRRCVALPCGLIGGAALLNGAPSSGLIAFGLAAWLLVRMRPAICWTALGIPLLTSMILAPLFPQYGAGVLVAVIMGTAVIGSAWLARSLAASRLAPLSSQDEAGIP